MNTIFKTEYSNGSKGVWIRGWMEWDTKTQIKAIIQKYTLRSGAIPETMEIYWKWDGDPSELRKLIKTFTLFICDRGGLV